MTLAVMAPPGEMQGASLFSSAFAPGAQRLATGDSRGDLTLWDLTGGDSPAVVPASCRKPWRLAFSPDGGVLVGVGEDGDLVICNTLDCEEWTAPNLEMDGTGAVAVAAGGRAPAAAPSSGVIVWDVRAGRRQAVIDAPADDVLSLAFSPSGALLAGGGRSGAVQFWDPSSGQCRAGAQACRGPVTVLAFTPDGRLLAASGEDQTVVLLDVASGRARGLLRGYHELIESMAFSPDGRTLVTAGYDGVVRLWDAAACRERARLSPEQGPIGSVAAALDGSCTAGVRALLPSRVWTDATRRAWRSVNEGN